jgi:hypothetical protein
MTAEMEPFKIRQWKPGVQKTALLFLAGALWMVVGTLLDVRAYSWLKSETQIHALLAAAAGFAAALLIHHFGFLRIVDRNLGRILPMEGKRCVFSFMPWKSYLLIALMILFGSLLRRSPVPKLYVAVLYSGIGTALCLSSIRYLRILLQMRKNGEKQIP